MKQRSCVKLIKTGMMLTAILICLLVPGPVRGYVFEQGDSDFAQEESDALSGTTEDQMPEAADAPVPVPFDLDMTGEPEEVTNPCTSLSELRDYLADTAVNLITLQADIEMDIPYATFAPDHPVTVEMGDYTIFVSTPTVLGSNLRFEGNGDKQPLFHVTSTGLTGDGAEITARADGATAVQIYHRQYQFVSSLSIIADGKNAVAIRADGETNLSGLRIQARGEGGVGICFDNSPGVVLVYCIIDAEREAVTGYSNLELSVCILSPEPVDATVLEVLAFWRAFWEREAFNLLSYGYMVVQGQLPNLDETLHIGIVVERDGKFSAVDTMEFALTWDYDPEILNVPGEYTISATPSIVGPAMPEISLPNLKDGRPENVPLRIVAAGEQHLYIARHMVNFFGREYISISPLLNMDEDADHRLWHREGDGKWEVIEDDVNFILLAPEPDLINVYNLDLTKDHAFRLETLNGQYAGMSNTLHLLGGANYYMGNTGGDRDGTGQDDQGGALPPDNQMPIVPPYGYEPHDGGGVIPDAGEESDNEPGNDDSDSLSDNGDSTHTAPDSPDDSEQPLPPEKQSAIEYIAPVSAEDTSSGLRQQSTSSRLAAPADPPVSPITLDTGELDDLRDTQPHEITFIEGGVRIIVPTALLDALELVDGGKLTVELGSFEGGFTIRMFAGEREIGGFTGEVFSVYIPYDLDVPLSDIYCTDEQGNNYKAIARENGMLLFQLTATGAYSIHVRNEVVPSLKPGNDTPVPSLDPGELPLVQALAEQTPGRSGGFLWAGLVVAGCTVLTLTAALTGRLIKTRKKHG